MPLPHPTLPCAVLCCHVCAQELLYWQGLFKDFYSKHYSTYRQLMWQHSLSTAMLRANFPKGPKELSVSLMQVCVGRKGELWGGGESTVGVALGGGEELWVSF